MPLPGAFLTWPVLLIMQCRQLAKQQMMPYLPGDPLQPAQLRKTYKVPQSDILAHTAEDPAKRLRHLVETEATSELIQTLQSRQHYYP